MRLTSGTEGGVNAKVRELGGRDYVGDDALVRDELHGGVGKAVIGHACRACECCAFKRVRLMIMCFRRLVVVWWHSVRSFHANRRRPRWLEVGFGGNLRIQRPSGKRGRKKE